MREGVKKRANKGRKEGRVHTLPMKVTEAPDMPKDNQFYDNCPPWQALRKALRKDDNIQSSSQSQGDTCRQADLTK